MSGSDSCHDVANAYWPNGQFNHVSYWLADNETLGRDNDDGIHHLPVCTPSNSRRNTKRVEVKNSGLVGDMLYNKFCLPSSGCSYMAHMVVSIRRIKKEFVSDAFSTYFT
jgi:hypothetical protein